MQRIREYLQAQAAEKSLPELVSRVREAIAELVAAAESLEAHELTEIPATDTGEGDAWTPMDCMKHIFGLNAHIGREILYVAHTGELPPNEDDTLSDDREALLKLNAEAMEQTYAHVEDADPDANLDVKWRHPMFGDLNWREWFLFLRIHARDHARQLEAMRESLRR
jgi:hypothetical protein